MITPAFSLTATERVLPRMALDFTTAILDARVTVTRALNTATRINSSGSIEAVDANLPRFDFDPTTLLCKGLSVEEARTNLFLNSLIDGTNLATQSVTLPATAHTLSFYGAGTIGISGGHTATVAGLGAYPARKTYVFTPSAGSSTFTVSGDVKYAQIEAGAFATSFIPTAATSAARNADVVSMTGANFSGWFNVSEGTFTAEYDCYLAVTSVNKTILAPSDGTTSNRLLVYIITTGLPSVRVSSGGATQGNINNTIIADNTVTRSAMAYKNASFAMATNAGTVGSFSTGVVPVGMDRLEIGCFLSASQLNGHVRKIAFYPQRLINAEVQAFSKV